VVRISGPEALHIGQAVTGRALRPRRATFATFTDIAGESVDEGISLYFPAPGSFTGEHVVELQGHGGPVVMHLLLDAVLGRGARMARPGEFTERAFHNGRLDLAQAEAVADLISSASAAAARGALRSLRGDFSEAVNALDRLVLELRMFVEAAMDFPEEEVDFLSEGQVGDRLGRIHQAFAQLIGNSQQGILLRDGITVALVGEPNVGKSSLLNALSGEERAIVTDIPGTTRDLVQADLSIDGMPVQVVDTAGLRETKDRVELEGVRRAREQAARADLVLLVVDDRTASAAERCPLLAQLLAAPLELEPRRIVRIRNKADLSGQPTGIVGGDAALPLAGEVRVSAMTGGGMAALRDLIKNRVGFAGEGTTFTARRRHLLALEEGLAALERAEGLLVQGIPGELIAEELRAVHQALGSIVGETSADDLLGEIFASFCIGK